MRGQGVDLLDQGGVPGAGQGRWYRKARAPGHRQTMGHLLVEEHGYAKAGLLHRKALGGVGERHRILGRPKTAIASIETGKIRRPRDLPDAMRDGDPRLFSREAAGGVHDRALGGPEATKLRHLLVEGHPSQQVTNPSRDRQGRVLVVGPRHRLSACWRHGASGQGRSDNASTCKSRSACALHVKSSWGRLHQTHRAAAVNTQAYGIVLLRDVRGGLSIAKARRPWNGSPTGRRATQRPDGRTP
jgi:hypothetical protein